MQSFRRGFTSGGFVRMGTKRLLTGRKCDITEEFNGGYEPPFLKIWLKWSASFFFWISDWHSKSHQHELVKRQLSVSSDSKLLDEDICEETRVILRPKKPPRPKSEVFLTKNQSQRRTKRYSAFGVSNIVLHIYFLLADPPNLGPPDIHSASQK